MAFPPRFLDELRARLPLSGLVGRRVRLTRRGREHSGLCPFHNEKTPSFTVSDEKGFFHCFGCGAHGDVVGFEMRSGGLSFIEAVEKLAGEAGLEVPKASPEERARAQAAASLAEVVEAACAFFEKQLRLPAGRAAMDYLKGRGLDDDTIARFRLGYAPPGNALKAALARENIALDAMVEAGVIGRPDDGRPPYDYFRDRVMFPITDGRGAVIAFGGRVMGDGQPKYLNSPDSPLFQKGHVLYGYAQARKPALDAGMVVAVEGYMDVIGLSTAGIAHAVAPLGTALTESQIELLWRLAPEPVLCFDGDGAGRRAARRAAERALPILKPGLSLRFALLPEGKDPDDLVRGEGKAAMMAILEGARPLSEMVWRMLTEGRPLDTPERRAAIEKHLGEYVDRIQNTTVQHYYKVEFRRKSWETLSSNKRSGKQSFVTKNHNVGADNVIRALFPRSYSKRIDDLLRRELAALSIIEPDILAKYFEEIIELFYKTEEFNAVLASSKSLLKLIEEAGDVIVFDMDVNGDQLRASLVKRGFKESLDLLSSDMERVRLEIDRQIEKSSVLASIRSRYDEIEKDLENPNTQPSRIIELRKTRQEFRDILLKVPEDIFLRIKKAFDVSAKYRAAKEAIEIAAARQTTESWTTCVLLINQYAEIQDAMAGA